MRGRKSPNIDDAEYTKYPYDFWELISDYIPPESVAKFSVICRDTYTIVNQASFWTKLYKDLYREDVANKMGMPSHLKPDCMSRQFRLK